jgi:long-subunit fatty acid transport protein
LLSSSVYSVASNTSGVNSHGVKADDRSMQLRIALSPGDENGQQDNWACRLHYQYAFNDEFRGRMILQYRERGSVQYEYIRAELLYNFKKS